MTYLLLTIEVTSASILVAAALFWLARMIASGNPELETHLNGSGGVIFGLFVVSFALSQSWKQLKVAEPDSEPRFRKRRNRFGQTAGGFAILCSGVAIAAGVHRGVCDATISRFTGDLKQFQDIGQSIGDARKGAGPSIEDNVQMYESIEPKVAQARAIVVRLRTEMPRCGDFQTRTGQFEFILNNLDQQMALLSREIEVAKSIASSPLSEREREWQSELVPLVDQEASLVRQSQTTGQQ